MLNEKSISHLLLARLGNIVEDALELEAVSDYKERMFSSDSREIAHMNS